MGAGDGSQLCFKFLREIAQKDIIAISIYLKNHITPNNPYIFTEDPVATGFISIIDEKTAEQNLPSILKSKQLIICCNTTPYQKFSRIVGLHGYSATASVSHHQDLSAKIETAYEMENKLRFIEVLAPCPKKWGYETSNTVHISKAAVDSGIWPLFNIENKKLKLKQRPPKLGLVEDFHNYQDKYIFEKEEVEKSWKELVRTALK